MMYASETKVSPEKTRAEIDSTLQRYGATGFLYYARPERAVIGFELGGRSIRFELAMPDPGLDCYTHTAGGKRRSPSSAAAAHGQAVRQRWRALLLVIKAKLEAVEAGIVEFDHEFLAHIVTPSGQTVGEVLAPQLEARLAGKGEGLLLPDYSEGGR